MPKFRSCCPCGDRHWTSHTGFAACEINFRPHHLHPSCLQGACRNVLASKSAVPTKSSFDEKWSRAGQTLLLRQRTLGPIPPKSLHARFCADLKLPQDRLGQKSHRRDTPMRWILTTSEWQCHQAAPHRTGRFFASHNVLPLGQQFSLNPTVFPFPSFLALQ